MVLTCKLEEGALAAPVQEKVIYVNGSGAEEMASEKKKPELPKALNEDVKAVAKDFRMIAGDASPMLRTY